MAASHKAQINPQEEANSKTLEESNLLVMHLQMLGKSKDLMDNFLGMETYTIQKNKGNELQNFLGLKILKYSLNT